jgi:hypothetical protein
VAVFSEGIIVIIIIIIIIITTTTTIQELGLLACSSLEFIF